MSESAKTKHITLSAFAARIAAAIENGIGGEQWVTAEVSSLQVNHSGHCYLELTERNAGQQMPSAVCRAVIWANRFRAIAAYFRHQTGGDIQVGMKILVRCQASYHPVYGLSLVITDIDPTYTLGEVERIRQQTIAKLKQEGVFEMNRELELPPVIQRIAVISSATAAGYGDFMNELNRSGVRFEVTLFQAIVQGEAAESSIISALGEAADEEEFDAVVIIRGGGSVSDLACFDSYNLCYHIAQFPLPVITGIGHDRDVSVADMVACLSLKTPTAVATHIVERAMAFLARLDKAEQYIVAKAQEVVMHQSRILDNQSLQLSAVVQQYIHSNTIKINAADSALRFACAAVMERQRNQLINHVQGLERSAGRVVERERELNAKLLEQIRSLATQYIMQQSHKIEMLAMAVESANPRRILKLGYAIVNNGLQSVDGVKEGDILTIEMADGTVTAQTQKICLRKKI